MNVRKLRFFVRSEVVPALHQFMMRSDRLHREVAGMVCLGGHISVILQANLFEMCNVRVQTLGA